MPSKPSLHPRYWSGWLAVLLIRLCAALPRRWSAPSGRLLGAALYHLLPRRRAVAVRNLERCFPALDMAQRQRLLKDHFQALGRMLFENAWVWSGVALEQLPKAQFIGLEHLEVPPGTPLLVVSGHFTGMDLGGRLLAARLPLAGVYRPLRNPVLEWFQTRGRLRYTPAMISKYDFKALMRYLSAGNTVWYAPDQDFGPQRSCFAPFFGHSTATLKATWLLARRTGAQVVTMFPQRLDDGHYRITIQPPLDPQTDALDFLTQLNQRIEDAVRSAPEQYWWVHRRFKTQPPDAASPYEGL